MFSLHVIYLLFLYLECFFYFLSLSFCIYSISFSLFCLSHSYSPFLPPNFFHRLLVCCVCCAAAGLSCRPWCSGKGSFPPTLRAFFPGSQGQASQMSPADTQLSKDCIPGSKHSFKNNAAPLLTLENVFFCLFFSYLSDFIVLFLNEAMQ